jgi:hypothetical protein
MQDLMNDASLNDLNNNLQYNINTRALYGNSYADFVEDFEVSECKYYSEAQVKTKLNSMEDFLSIFSLNCRSIHSNQNQIGDMIDSINEFKLNISIITLQEVWYRNTDLSFGGFKLFSKCRTGNSRVAGGGVGFLINNNLQAEILENNFFLEHIHEAICARVCVKNLKFVIVSLYRPPSNSARDITDFFNMFNDLLDYLADLNTPAFITGDLNLDLFKLRDLNSNSTTLFESLIANGFVSTIGRATRIAINSATLLDIIGVRGFIQNLTISGVMTSTISDHYVPFNVFNLNFKTKKDPQYFDKRTFSQQNMNNFTLSLAFEGWDTVLSSNVVNEASAFFIDKFIHYYNEHIPKKRVRFNKRTMPINKWQFKGLLKCRLKKLNLEAFSKTSDATAEDVKNYTDYRNNYNRAASKAKKIYYRKRVRDAGKDSKKLWDILKESMGEKKDANEVEFLEVGGIKIEWN